MYVRVEWHKARTGYHSLEVLDLDGVRGGGIYLIWSGEERLETVYVGISKDDIAGKLGEHQKDVNILKCARSGLYVSWADLQEDCLQGMERYFADTLRPLVKHAYSNDKHIEGNLPIHNLPVYAK